MKRCLVTGGSGFVGANLVRRLIAAEYETHVLLSPEHQLWRLRDITGLVRMHSVDLSDGDQVHKAVRAIRPEWVFHLAAYGAYSTQTGFARMVDVNVTGTASLLDASAETGVEAFIYT